MLFIHFIALSYWIKNVQSNYDKFDHNYSVAQSLWNSDVNIDVLLKESRKEVTIMLWRIFIGKHFIAELSDGVFILLLDL